MLISWWARVGQVSRHKLVVAVQLSHLIFCHHLCAPVQARRARKLTNSSTWVLFLVPALHTSCATTHLLARSNVCLWSSLPQPFLSVNWRIWLWSNLFDVLSWIESAASIVIIWGLFRAHIEITVHELAAGLGTQNFVWICCVRQFYRTIWTSSSPDSLDFFGWQISGDSRDYLPIRASLFAHSNTILANFRFAMPMILALVLGSIHNIGIHAGYIHRQSLAVLVVSTINWRPFLGRILFCSHLLL